MSKKKEHRINNNNNNNNKANICVYTYRDKRTRGKDINT